MAYFANGTEGERLSFQCNRCPLGAPDAGGSYEGGGCRVLMVSLIYNYEQLDKGNELLREAMSLQIADDGICEIREQLVTIGLAEGSCRGR